MRARSAGLWVSALLGCSGTDLNDDATRRDAGDGRRDAAPRGGTAGPDASRSLDASGGASASTTPLRDASHDAAPAYPLGVLDASPASDPSCTLDAAAFATTDAEAGLEGDAQGPARCEPPCCFGCDDCGSERTCLTGQPCWRICGCDNDSCLFQCVNQLSCRLVVKEYVCTSF